MGEFAVDQAKLGEAVEQLDRAGRDFAVLTKDYLGTVCDSSAAFGEFGVDGAWAGFDSAWAAELRQTGSAITELTGQVEAAGADYRTTDGVAAGRVEKAGPR